MISFKDFICELFDKPWDLEDVTHEPHNVDFIKRVQKQTGARRPKLYKAEGDNGHILEYPKDNAVEIHHVSPKGSGFMDPDAKKPNPRYISTMKDRIHKHIQNSNRVRIIAPANSSLADHYYKIGSALAKKHGYEIDKPKSFTHELGIEVTTFHISPPDKTGGLSEMLYPRS